MRIKTQIINFINSLKQRIQRRRAPSEIEQLTADLHQLQQSILELRRRLPPSGWSTGNYFLLDDPTYSICLNTVERRWVIWHQGVMVCEAPTMEECLRLFKNVRSP